MVACLLVEEWGTTLTCQREGVGTPARGQKFTPAQGRRPRAGVNFWPRAGVPTPSRGQVKVVSFQLFQGPVQYWILAGGSSGYYCPGSPVTDVTGMVDESNGKRKVDAVDLE